MKKSNTLTLTLRSGLTITVSVHVGRGVLLLSIIPLLIKSHGLTIVQGLETLFLDLGEVDEDIFLTIITGDESESLIGKELNFTSRLETNSLDALLSCGGQNACDYQIHANNFLDLIHHFYFLVVTVSGRCR